MVIVDVIRERNLKGQGKMHLNKLLLKIINISVAINSIAFQFDVMFSSLTTVKVNANMIKS